jgi:hypothetical protein
MAFPLNDLGKALTTPVMGGDDKIPSPKNTLFTWCMPGLPFTPDDLDFCAKGIFSAPAAYQMKSRLMHAFNLAMLLDFLPDIGAPYSNERQEGMYKKRLSEVYRQILAFQKLSMSCRTTEACKNSEQSNDGHTGIFLEGDRTRNLGDGTLCRFHERRSVGTNSPARRDDCGGGSTVPVGLPLSP